MPFSMSDVIDERTSKRESKRDLPPYRALKTRLQSITLEPGCACMFGWLTIAAGMERILGRMFRVPVDGQAQHDPGPPAGAGVRAIRERHHR